MAVSRIDHLLHSLLLYLSLNNIMAPNFCMYVFALYAISSVRDQGSCSLVRSYARSLAYYINLQSSKFRIVCLLIFFIRPPPELLPVRTAETVI